MYSITRVLAATAILSDDQPALAPRGWPTAQYSTTKLTTVTPASCFSTPSKPVVKCSTTTPMVPKTLSWCSTKTICSDKTIMVKGTPVVVKQTSYIPEKPIWTPAPPPQKPEWKPSPPETPKLTTKCTTKYSTVSGKPCSTTQTLISPLWTLQPPKSSSQPAKSTTQRPAKSSSQPAKSTSSPAESISQPEKSTPSSSSSCKKTSTPLIWYPESTTSVKADTSAALQSSAQPIKSTPVSAKSSIASSSKVKSSSKATATKSSNSTTSKFTMPTHPIPTMESSASGFGGVSVVLSVIAAVALAMAAL